MPAQLLTELVFDFNLNLAASNLGLECFQQVFNVGS